MMTTEDALDYATVLRAVRTWCAKERFALVQDVLRTLEPLPEGSDRSRHTFERALGLLATDTPPPSDEEVQRMLEDYRLEKYG